MILPTEVMPVPLRDATVVVIAPLAATVAAVALVPLLRQERRPQEILAHHATRRRIATRATSLVFLAVPFCVLADVAGVAARSALLAGGVVLIAGSCLRTEVVWLVPFLIATSTWLTGTDLAGQPKPWALPLLPIEAPLAAWCCATAAVVGVALGARPQINAR